MKTKKYTIQSKTSVKGETAFGILINSGKPIESLLMELSNASITISSLSLTEFGKIKAADGYISNHDPLLHNIFIIPDTPNTDVFGVGDSIVFNDSENE